MKRLGVSTAQRAQAERPRQVWSWDFVEDQTENGSRFRILTILDEHTRQCVAVHAAWSIRSVDVITVLEAAIACDGAPEHLRSDDEPEFIAYVLQHWLETASRPRGSNTTNLGCTGRSATKRPGEFARRNNSVLPRLRGQATSSTKLARLRNVSRALLCKFM
jgi:hypothetical protein